MGTLTETSSHFYKKSCDLFPSLVKRSFRTVFFTSSAPYARRGSSGIWPEGSTHEIIDKAMNLSFCISSVKCGKCSGNIDIFRTRYAVSAAGASDFYFCVYCIDDFSKHILLIGTQLSDIDCRRRPDIIKKHFLRIHTRQNNRDLWLVPEPTEGPLGRCPLDPVVFKDTPCILRQTVHEEAP